MQNHKTSGCALNARARFSVCAATTLLAMALPLESVAADTLQRVAAAGKVTLGYATDAPPFSSRDDAGKPAGFAVTLCDRVAGEIKSKLGNAALTIEWVPVTAEGGLSGVQQGSVDLLCNGTGATLTKRQSVSFSIPIFPGGTAAVLRANASDALRNVLEERPPPYQPAWRGSVPRVLQGRTFAVVAGTPTVAWLDGRVAAFKVPMKVTHVESYEAGIRQVIDGSSDVLVGDRATLLDAAWHSTQRDDLKVLGRHFTYEPIALVLQRGDDDFRLLVDRALTRLYASPEFGDIYAQAFGKPDADTVGFFRMTAVPE